MAERIALIVNPRSGRGRGEALCRRVQAELLRRGLPVQVLATEAPSHAVELARCAAPGVDLVLVLGGDGTVRDVADGLEQGQFSGAVGILCGGTGNDLARALQIPSELEASLDLALTGTERSVDLWRWNRSLFVNVAGLGLDAAVASLVNRRYRSMRGSLPYILALLTLLPRYKPQEIRITCSGGEWGGQAWLAAFGNGRFYGGGMEIAPTAVPDDGLLDAVVIGAVPKVELLRQLPGLFRGAHAGHPAVTFLRSDAFQVEAADQEVTIDGELIDRAPGVIRRVERALRVRVPTVPR